jgi:hypothetical protein
MTKCDVIVIGSLSAAEKAFATNRIWNPGNQEWSAQLF